MTITQTGRRVALVGLLALIAAVLPFTGAGAISGDVALQLSADGNVATSIANSQVVYTPHDDTPTTPPTEALIGRADLFADNLASGALQGAALADGRPLLLNDETDGLNADVLAELDRLLGGTGTVHILGGEAAQGQGVADALEAAGYTVNRFEGATRTETAIAIATATGADTALLVRNAAAPDSTDETQAYADALGGGALAATNGYSVLFTQTDVLTQSTADYLASEDGPSNVIIVGGTAAVSEDVETAVGEIEGITVTRAAGATRFDTAVELNGLRDADTLGGFAIAVEGQADAWADGFSMANLSGLNNAPLVLTNNGEVPQATADYLASIDEDTAAFADGHTADAKIVCGSSIGDACPVIPGLTIEPFPPAEEPVTDNTGVIVGFTFGADYDYQPEDGSPVQTVDFADDDFNVFTVDGAPATYDAFSASMSVGDTITVTVDDAGTPDDDSDDITTHDLVNVAAAETGTVGNVNTATGTFDIIEPVSGATISAAPIDYLADCDLFSLNGGVVIAAQFEAALNEGDTFDTSEDAAGNVTCILTDGTVSGTVTVGDTPGAEYFMIGTLGDDFASTNNDTFVASMAKFDAGDLVITVDGAAITDYADFSDVLSSGDQADYSRTNDTETVSLVNGSPTTISGQLVDGGTSVAFDIATNPGLEPVAAAGDPDTRYIVNGFVALAADFDAAATAGDQVSYTPEDAAAGTPETVTLTDQDLSGAVEDDLDPGDIDIALTTYDVLSSAGDVILATVDYTAGAIADRYMVGGEEVDQPDFEAGLTEIVDGDATGVMTVTDSALATTHSLMLTEI